MKQYKVISKSLVDDSETIIIGEFDDPLEAHLAALDYIRKELKVPLNEEGNYLSVDSKYHHLFYHTEVLSLQTVS